MSDTAGGSGREMIGDLRGMYMQLCFEWDDMTDAPTDRGPKRVTM